MGKLKVTIHYKLRSQCKNKKKNLFKIGVKSAFHRGQKNLHLSIAAQFVTDSPKFSADGG